MRLPRKLHEILRFLPLIDVNDTRQVGGTCVPISHLKRIVGLSRLLIKILAVERMTMFIRFAVSYIPSIVPILRL